MERRDVIMLGGLAALAALGGAPAGAATAPEPDPNAKVHVTHIFATPDGESHLELLEVAPGMRPVPLTSLVATAYHPTNVGWHNVPTPQFAINMTGELEVEVSTGTKKRIGPGDLVFLEDATGKGHVTRLVSPVTNLFIRVAPGFDVVAWAKGG